MDYLHMLKRVQVVIPIVMLKGNLSKSKAQKVVVKTMDAKHVCIPQNNGYEIL